MWIWILNFSDVDKPEIPNPKTEIQTRKILNQNPKPDFFVYEPLDKN